MLKSSLAVRLSCAGVITGLLATVCAAQTATPSDTQPDPTKVHFEGCLFTEAALTAKTPLVVPAGVTQTFVLTNVKVIAGAVPDADASKNSYTLARENQDDGRMFYGQRVAIVGHVKAGTPRPVLEVVSLRPISGGCPTLPGLR